MVDLFAFKLHQNLFKEANKSFWLILSYPHLPVILIGEGGSYFQKEIEDNIWFSLIGLLRMI